MRIFEGFAGYGGASFAFNRTNIRHEIVGYSEVDKFACQLYEANFNNSHNYGDISKINPNELPDFDMFTGGFPCQPFSSAGMMQGENDIYGRGTLVYHILRICKAKKPRYILLENVKGILSKRFATTFEVIRNTLTDIGYGNIQYTILNTKDYGIPQNRARVWIFAQLGGLPEDFNMIPTRVENCPTLGEFLDHNVPKELYLSQAQIAHLKEKHGIKTFVVDRPLCFDVYNKKIKTDDICVTLTQPEHNSIRVIEVPHDDGLEIVRKLTIPEQFRLMGFRNNEINFAGLSYSQLSKRAGNGWDINVVSRLLEHLSHQVNFNI